MRRWMLCMLCCLVLFVQAGCVATSTAPKPTTPIGIVKAGDIDCYIIELPIGKTGEDYFDLIGGEGTIVLSKTDVSTYYENIGAVYNRRVEQGGWVTYTKERPWRIMYLPETVSKEQLAAAAYKLVYATQGMTIKEAQKYISWLGQD